MSRLHPASKEGGTTDGEVGCKAASLSRRATEWGCSPKKIFLKMQIKIFSIPTMGGEALNEEMNSFLRSKKVLQVEGQLAQESGGAYWSFYVKYVDSLAVAEREKPKVDYRTVLDEATFARFSKLREIRKGLSGTENVPAYTIFSDEELAELAKMEVVTESSMRMVKGIGDKKMEKYARYFLTAASDEKG